MIFPLTTLLVTSRESDWYNYSGDLSNIHSLKVIKPTLNEQDAVEIFKLFKSAHRLHPSISTWQSAWGKIAERKLLIEYVYLLTHGEMLAERITSQISEIGRSSSGIVKCEILRQVCFADICGIRLSISKLLMNLSENFSLDFGEILKSLESEFLVQVSDKSGYIEGLHPVRSKHIVDKLHEFLPVDSTAISVIKITEKADLPTLFSHLPEFALNKEDFCHNAVDALWNEDDLSNYIPAIRGLFSGSVMQYYLSNKAAFDDANIHGGLPILLTEVCPFTKFTEFGVSVDTFATLQKVEPENKNIKYLCNLRDNIPTYSPKDTLIYVFCTCLYRKLFPLTWGSIKDITSYAAIAEWLYNMNPEFNLSVNFPLDDIWTSSKRLSLECISTLMYISYCGNKDVYTIFVTKNLSRILTYLKHQTKSYELFVDFKNNAIHVSYILPLCEVRTSNEQSVSRLKCICKTLPIFDLYCADGLKPTINMLSIYTIPDDAHKRMPLKNLVIIIVNNFDTVLKDNSAAFVLNCIEFAEAPFDYLVILSANNSNHINPIALQFSRQMFIDVKKAIRSNDSAALENITYPYPVNVTSSMLDCFIGNYNLLEKSPSAPDLSSIGDIAENLWIYSKSVELLSTPEDADYLASETQRLRTNITEMLQLSRDQLSKKDFDWLVDICNQVFSGKEFDDKLFNDIIEHFTSQAENC